RDDRQAERPEHRAGPLALRAERHGEEPHRGEDVDELERKPKRRYRVEDQTETWSGQRPASSSTTAGGLYGPPVTLLQTLLIPYGQGRCPSRALVNSFTSARNKKRSSSPSIISRREPGTQPG